MSKGLIIAVDGPSGAGKSSVSRELAIELKGKLLDTGATYRAAAYFVIKEKANSEEQFTKIAEQLKFSWDKTGLVLLAGGKDLGPEIRTEEVSLMASCVSRFPSVRDVLTQKQRDLGNKASLKTVVVAEGRDVGTVVFPDTPFKFFITADTKVRAQRRYQQLREMGEKSVTFEEVLHQQMARDKQDSTRDTAPLRCAKDALVVDTSKMDISQAVQFIKFHI